MDMGYGGVKGVFAGRRKDGMEYHGESSLVDLIELQRKKKGDIIPKCIWKVLLQRRRFRHPCWKDSAVPRETGVINWERDGLKWRISQSFD